jgi:outer membrane receptor protein involved in Fe transport
VLNGYDPTVQKTCYASGGSSPACLLQVRAGGNYTMYSPQNTVLLWYQTGVNIAGIETKGIDFEANYHGKIAERAFSVRALATYKPHLIYSQAGAQTIDQAGAAYDQNYGLLLPSPVWRTQLIMAYNAFQGFDLAASVRWRSAMHFQADRTLLEIGHVASVAYTNLNLSYALPKWPKSSFYLNVQNLFDKAPPPAGPAGVGLPGNSGNGWAIGDDVIGRYYTVGFRGNF